MDNGTDGLPLRIAAFLRQALDLEEPAAALAPEVRALKRDPNAGIWTVELDSSVGPTAFLVYHYLLDVRGEHERTGQELFDADLATLERAAERDTPGPRILAHAIAAGEAYILATTPATFRALTGAGNERELEATPGDLLPTADTAKVRQDAASELLRLLHAADQHAQTWLSAIRSEERLRSAPAADEELIEFNDEETALALFLLDDRSIQHLLRVLNLVIDNARRKAAGAMNENSQS